MLLEPGQLSQFAGNGPPITPSAAGASVEISDIKGDTDLACEKKRMTPGAVFRGKIFHFLRSGCKSDRRPDEESCRFCGEVAVLTALEAP